MLYNSDHADPAELEDDFPCADLREALETMRWLIDNYTVGFTAQTVSGGNEVEVRGDAVVTLWPKEAGYAPVHFTVRFCDEEHQP
jgi:hypothetical protein